MKSVYLISSIFLSLASAKITRHVGSKLLMISMDGFRWDYLNRDQLDLKHFHDFIDQGVRAKVRIEPQFNGETDLGNHHFNVLMENGDIQEVFARYTGNPYFIIVL